MIALLLLLGLSGCAPVHAPSPVTVARPVDGVPKLDTAREQLEWANARKRELFAREMFENRVHGSCTSSAIYLCGGLRAAGVPTRIVLVIPFVDANDPEQLALVENGIRHHRVRATALAGLRSIIGSWASHTFNEVLVGGRWRRLNYTRLGQPTLDEDLYGSIALLWAILFVVISVLYRPVEQLLSHTIAARRARGVWHASDTPASRPGRA